MNKMRTNTGDKSSYERRVGKRYKAPAAVASGFGESAIESVFGETVALFHCLRATAEEIHRQGETTSGKRGVLRGLDRFGLQTVPQMARARPVSRQYIQTLVNQLVEQGYVEFIENPAHKRSPLVHLTQRGKDLIKEMNRREEKILEMLKIEIEERDLRLTARVLRKLRACLEDKEWKRFHKSGRKK
ncbi:MAG: MarR family transcriptional regulator [Candidatus Dadabacteria bacterium]|nr:MarR family transcriptional regulator [Candidatus Dadabacteria bacterium]